MWANDVPVQPCLPFGDVFDDEQARINEYIVDFDDPVEGRISVGGKPLTVTPPQTIKGPAPAHGAHTAEVLARVDGGRHRAVGHRHAPRGSRSRASRSSTSATTSPGPTRRRCSPTWVPTW